MDTSTPAPEIKTFRCRHMRGYMAIVWEGKHIGYAAQARTEQEAIKGAELYLLMQRRGLPCL